jgi:hypothetical protein
MFLQVPVYQRHGHRALADRGRHPLDRLGPHVTGHEHAGDRRLEVVRITVERPAPRALATGQQVRAGADEAVLVAVDVLAEPVGARRRADEDEQVAALDRLRDAVLAQRQPLEVVVAVGLLDRRVGPVVGVVLCLLKK